MEISIAKLANTLILDFPISWTVGGGGEIFFFFQSQTVCGILFQQLTLTNTLLGLPCPCHGSDAR